MECGILAGRSRKKGMETRTGCYRAFRQHMMAAVCDGECNIGEHLAELLRCDPVIGIVAVVVVTVHRHNI